MLQFISFLVVCVFASGNEVEWVLMFHSSGLWCAIIHLCNQILHGRLCNCWCTTYLLMGVAWLVALAPSIAGFVIQFPKFRLSVYYALYLYIGIAWLLALAG